jgi:hypothetical protein
MTTLDHTLTNFEIGGIFLDQGQYFGPARNISLVGQYGELTLYELNSSAFLPRIYATSGMMVVNSTRDFLSNLDLFDPTRNVMIQSSEMQRQKIPLPTSGGQEPTLSFQMISPSQYDVRVSASSGFMLVLSETYNPLWIASGPWGTVPESNHFIVNGYANMWYITQRGSYSLRLSFLPNHYLTYGTLVALLAAILGFTAVYAKSVKRFALKLSFVLVASVRSMNTWKIRIRAVSYYCGRNARE